MRKLFLLLMMCATMTLAQNSSAPKASTQKASTRKISAPAFPDAAELNKMAARFAPTEMRVDTSLLSAGDKKALVKLIEASQIVNHLFMQQLWSGDLALYSKLQEDKSALGKARLHYFWINKGPWSEIDEHKAFLPNVPAPNLQGPISILKT